MDPVLAILALVRCTAAVCEEPSPAVEEILVLPPTQRVSSDDFSCSASDRDAEAALARGDYALLGIQGFTSVVPGVPPGPLDWPHGVRFVEPAPGDLIVTSAELTSSVGSFRYAENYNRRILSAIDPSLYSVSSSTGCR